MSSVKGLLDQGERPALEPVLQERHGGLTGGGPGWGWGTIPHESVGKKKENDKRKANSGNHGAVGFSRPT